MQVGQIASAETVRSAKATKGQAPENRFSQILHSTGNAPLPGPSPMAGKPGPAGADRAVYPGAQSSEVTQARKPVDPVFLGNISPEAPTVSDILIRHPEYKKNAWSIIHAGPNQEKPFTRMRPGTQVYINAQTHELTWTSGGAKSSPVVSGLSENALEATPPIHKAPFGPLTHPTQAILLGTISPETPTVSDILIQHPVYKKDAWPIIHAEANEDKPFTHMPTGAQVYLNPETFELTWGMQLEKESEIVSASGGSIAQEVAAPDTGEDPFSDSLVKAVEPLVGSPYEKLNCYEMVVVGLKNLGIRYEGRGGLAEKMIRMAAAKGLPTNAYFNGEGLVAVSGQQVYAKTLPRVTNLDRESEKLYQEMEPRLRRGFILSFSTPTRGHTGIVSRKDELWTYINSGNLDHSVKDGMIAKGVGEELLRDELKNWLRLAAERKEPLQITLGRIQEAKLQAHTA